MPKPIRGELPWPFGLANVGSICYFNSLLQALVSCPPLLRDAPRELSAEGATPVSRALAQFVQEASGPQGPPPEASARMLQVLVAELRRRRPRTRYGQGQESASEGLVLLLEMLDDGSSLPAARFAPPGGGTRTARASPLVGLFVHRYRYRQRCEACGAESEPPPCDPGVIVHLKGPAPAAGEKTPAGFAGRLLQTGPELLAGFRCALCGAVGRCVRAGRLTRAPEILAVAFDHYTAEGRARADRYFPASFVLPRGGTEPAFRYRCVAQVDHTGGLAGGHYVARAFRRTARGTEKTGPFHEAKKVDARTSRREEAEPNRRGAEKTKSIFLAGGGETSPPAAQEGYLFNDRAVSPAPLGPRPETYIVFYTRDGRRQA